MKIGTRSSPLALWQAKQLKKYLNTKNYNSKLIPIQSSGDINLTTPIYEFGVTGVFTKELDIALLQNTIDVAVHSLKDVPTQLPKDLTLAAVLERGAFQDVLLLKPNVDLKNKNIGIATGSIRRRSQWLTKYSTHNMLPVRGNVQTRLQKFQDNDNIDGIIFAKAGLERVDLLPQEAIVLDWMLPAPAQGIVGVVCREEDKQTLQILQKINHMSTYRVATIERQFMRFLEGGCSIPISALAIEDNKYIHFKGAMYAEDGTKCYTVEKTVSIDSWRIIAKLAVEDLLSQKGALELLEKIRANAN